MDEKTKELLLSAWHENRLAAIHIDLEKMYAPGNEHTFRAVGDFAGGLRANDVQNIWITFPYLKAQERIRPGVMTVAEFNAMANDPLHDVRSAMSETVRAQDSEAVVVKDWGSSFHQSSTVLHDYLRELKRDVILIDGVAGHECVAKTLDDGTGLDAYTFIAVQDCINLLPDQDYEAYMRWRGVKNPALFAQRFATASSDMILKTLEAQKTMVSSIFRFVMPPYKSLAHIPLLAALAEERESKEEKESTPEPTPENPFDISAFEPVEDVESFEGFEIVSKEHDSRDPESEQTTAEESPTDVFIYTNNLPSISSLLAAAAAAAATEQEDVVLVTKDNSEPPPALTP
jgi:nicotinamidase-related amidase